MNYRYFLLLAFAFCFTFSNKAQCQTYYNITTLSGPQTVGGITVNVSSNGSTASLSGCGVSPYRTNVGGFKYAFSSPATSIMVHFYAINSGDTMQISFNGSAYTVTSANLTNYQGTCTQTTLTVVATNGLIAGTVCGAPGLAQFDATPGYGIDSVWINEIASNCGGIIFDFFFASGCPGSVTASATYDTICTGNALNLHADTTAVSGTATFSWSGPNGFTSAQQNPTLINATTAAAGTYTVTVTDTGVCVYTSSVDITVNAAPSITASSNSPLCPGDTLDLSVSTVAGAGYNWSGPNAYSAALQNPSISNFVVADTGIYYVYATLNGCTSMTSTHVTLNNPGIPVITTNSPICAGDSLKFSASSSSAGVSYSWSGPNGFNSALQNPAIANAQTSNAGNYTVSVTLNNCSSSTTILAAVNPIAGPPAVSINVSPNDTICAGDNITLSALASNAGNAPGFQWRRNGANIAGANTAIFTTGAVANGDLLTCHVTSNAPCQAVDSSNSNTIHMHVVSLSPPVVSVTSYPVNYHAGDTVTFTGHVPTGSTGLTYYWTKNGTPITGANNIFYTTHNVSVGDTICLVVHTSVPCTYPDSTVICMGIPAGVTSPGLSKGEEIMVYPNPANNLLYIDAAEQVNISITGMDGKLLYTKSDAKVSDISQLADGIYILQVRDNNALILKTQKLVKIKQ